MKFYSKPIEEHAEVPVSDLGQFEQLVDSWTGRHPQAPAGRNNRCYVVCTGPWESPHARDAQTAELTSLVRAIGDAVVGHDHVQLHRPNPKTLLGKGAAQAVARKARAAGANLLVVDAELTPSQTRNLEDVTGLAICDREAVILNVFQQNARTKRARIQVEIAHLQFLRPRIRGIGLDMDQQSGGLKRARGPGETASELLARKLDGRLAQLRKQLLRFEKASGLQRKRRTRCTRISLVGYTNAGKTSLMNALTRAELSAADQPFETLDTTSRSLTRHGGDVVLSDTVGFIRRLPERLLASFATTLAEVCESDLLAFVIDASDPEWYMHLQTSLGILEQIGAGTLPRYYILNKLDLLDTDERLGDMLALTGDHPSMFVSSQSSRDMVRLREALIGAARRRHRRVVLQLPYERGDLISSVYARCQVEDTRATETGLELTFTGPDVLVADIESELGNTTQSPH